MKYYYTDKEFKELCKDIVILHDTREQENSHILEWFDRKKIQHGAKALSLGDYCFKISENSPSRLAGAWFTDEVFIERKNSLEELASSLCEGRFYRELREAVRIPIKILLVENASGMQDILAHKYSNKYDHKAYYNTLRALQLRYGIHIEFIPEVADNNIIGQAIWSICKTVLKGTLITS